MSKDQINTPETRCSNSIEINWILACNSRYKHEWMGFIGKSFKNSILRNSFENNYNATENSMLTH